jgi:hypothetical protein
MPVTADKPGPYATTGSMLDLIGRYRSRGLPSPVDNDALARVGVAQSLIPRTLQSLHTLDLVDPKTGMPTPTFDALRLSPEDEYKKRLEDWLKGAYADVFAIVDPATDGEARIRDAFRTYQPIGQQERMVLLFQGLCAAAGLMPAAEKTSRSAPSSRSTPAAPATVFTPRQRTIAKRIVAERFSNAARHPPRGPTADLPAPLAGLLAKLPAEGDSWTTAERDKFVTTFQAVLDFCFPIETRNANDGQDVTAVRQN